jgi:hypothetical protein
MAAMECSICLLPVMLLSDEEHVILYETNSIFYLKYQFCWATSFRLMHFFLSTKRWCGKKHSKNSMSGIYIYLDYGGPVFNTTTSEK